MTKYLNEYNTATNAIWAAHKVQSDNRKLKFNNIKSCIAVVLVPNGAATMVGVHLTKGNLNPADMTRVMQELQAAAGTTACDAYLVSAWSHYEGSNLKKELKKITRSIQLCDLPKKSSNDADVDVKFELAGTRVMAYVREHVLPLKGPGGAQVPNPNYSKATAAPGKPNYLTDRDDAGKQWMSVSFRPLH